MQEEENIQIMVSGHQIVSQNPGKRQVSQRQELETVRQDHLETDKAKTQAV